MFYFPALILDLRALVCELTCERCTFRFAAPFPPFRFWKKFRSIWKNSADDNNARQHYPGSIGKILFFFSLFLDLKSTSWDRNSKERTGANILYPARLPIFENIEIQRYLKSIIHRIDDEKSKN